MWFWSFFLIHLVIYFFMRLLFAVWNWSSLSVLSESELLLAFFHGFRFDLSALGMTLGLALLVSVWLDRHQKIRTAWLSFFIAINAAFYIINAIDVELYNFTAKRFASHSFFLARDATFSNLIAPYVPLASASIMLVVGYIFMTWRALKKFKTPIQLSKKVIISSVIFIISLVSARGGVQKKPLTFVDAKIFDNTYANNLILNSTFTVLKSASKKSLERVRYFDDEKLLSKLNPKTDLDVVPIFKEKPNFVVIILEGFSHEYSLLQNPEVMPNLNRLKKISANFNEAYANGRRSIEGVAAILSGIPALMEEPFINSEFSANQIIGLGQILNQHGYKTSFFHGASKGSMHFDSFTRSVGILENFSREDYPIKEHDDGTWGIFDEPFLKWTCEKIRSYREPFFSTIFTLSSHHPFQLPNDSDIRKKFYVSGLPILKTIQYTDDALAKFFNCMEQDIRFKNTVFIITADHTGPELQVNSSFLNRHRVPLLIYAPGADWISDIKTDQPAQHIDILPTILDLAGIQQKNYNYLSRSLLRSGPKLIALYSDGKYELAGNINDQEEQLKAVRQYFSQGLYDNRLYYPIK
jgi:phosphoglycerol transferase MdoB-like AlkP superfamily enzyme